MFGKDMEVGGNGKFSKIFSFEEGENRVRILAGDGSIKDRVQSHYVGGKHFKCFGDTEGCPYHGENAPKGKDDKDVKPSTQVGFYILDKNKEVPEVRFALLPWSVYAAIHEFSKSKDYGFDSLPMPYDITVTKNKKAASPKDMYKVLPSPKQDPVPQQYLDEVAGMEPISDKIKSLLGYAKKLHFGQGPEGAPSLTDEVPTINLEDEEIKPEDIPF